MYRLLCVCVFVFVFFFIALFVEYYWVIRILFLSECSIIIRRWGSGDDAASDV